MMDEVVERAGAAPPVPGAADAPVVLFDFDGVLVSGDTFMEFVGRRLRRGRWLLALPWAPVLAVLACRRRGRLAAGRFLVRCALFGMGATRYQRLVDGYVAGMVHGTRRFSRATIRLLRERVADGARVVVVSGCEDHLLHALLAGLGITGVEIVATQLRRGWFGMRVARQNVGAAKVVRLAELGIVPPWAEAYTDAWADLPLLQGAREAVLVNATPKLCKRVEKALGHSVTRIEWS